MGCGSASTEQRGVSDERLPLHSTLTFPRLYSAAVRPVLCANKGFPGGSVVKNPPAKAGDLGSIPGLGRYLEKEMAAHPSILAWRTPLTEKPGGLQPMGSQRVRHGLSDGHFHFLS